MYDKRDTSRIFNIARILLALPVMLKTPAGFTRLLLAAWLFMPSLAHEALAASWQWTSMPRRERVTITLDAPAADLRHSRTDRQAVSLDMPAPKTFDRTGPAPTGARLVDDVTSDGQGVRITTRLPGFGYIVTRPDPRRVVVDIFEDPLGNQWQPPATSSGAARPAPQTPAPQTPAPQTPAVSAPPPVPVTPPAATSSAAQPVTPPAPPTPLRQKGGIVERPITDTPGSDSSVSGQLAPGAPVTPAAPAAPQTAAPHTGADRQRAYFTVPYALRARVNFGGPEEWPQDQAVSATVGAPQGNATANGSTPPPPEGGVTGRTAPRDTSGPSVVATPESGQPAPVAEQPVAGTPEPLRPVTPPAAASPAPGNGTTTAAAEPHKAAATGNATAAGGNASAIVYVDEKGNPVPPPPDPPQLLAEAKTLISTQDWPGAMEKLGKLKGLPDIPADMREEVLYLISDTLFAQNKDTIPQAFDSIMDATSEAMNYNLRSPRVPLALLRLGLLNLRAGNTREAEAYFALMKKQYPHDDNIPLAYFYLGEDQFRKGLYQKAADQFQFILQNHPESRYVRESSVFLARALHRMGYLDQASTIMDFVDKRWPRLYLETPEYLLMAADVETQTGRLDQARASYWTYYNINPEGAENDVVLAKLGDIYARQGHAKPAREIYDEALRRFPDKDGGLIALLRLTEQGIYDKPDVTSMFSVFDTPGAADPAEAYNRIIKGHPKSALVPMARIKLAMWHLWKKQYPEALQAMAEFAAEHGKHELLDKAREVAVRAFGLLAADAVKEGDYDRVLQFWEDYPIVRDQEKNFGPEFRLALGMSFWKKDRPGQALEMLAPLIKQPPDALHGEAALNLSLTVYLGTESWQQILDLASSVSGWKLTPAAQRQRDYAVALAHENLGQQDKSVPLWEKLDQNPDLPEDQKAYVTFFLSRDAERKRDLQQAYLLNKDALARFVALAEKDKAKADNARIRDCIASLMDITEAAGRTREALDWAGQYAHYLKEGTPEYTALNYRVARLHRKLGNTGEWKRILDGIIAKEPDSVYGRMAASELRTYDVTRGASSFTNSGGF